jgi:hypothetical protein
MQKSDSIKNIAKALAAFQSEVKNPVNTADNPFFKSKYAPLQDILNLVRPLLSKHGLSVLQIPSGDGEKIIITTLLMHESGEWIETCPLILKPDKPTAQGAGSAITYGRRYSLSAVLGISSEDDDDGNQASGNNDKQTTNSQNTTKKEIIKKLDEIRNDLGQDESGFLEGLSTMLKREIKSLKDIAEPEAQALIKTLNKAKERKVS